jgi:hypothetical protein
MTKEYFLSSVLPVGLCIAGVLYMLVTGRLDHRAKARETPGDGPTE